jgi:hypothetical protein
MLTEPAALARAPKDTLRCQRPGLKSRRRWAEQETGRPESTLAEFSALADERHLA